MNYRPEDPEWDAFIRRIYGPEIHGAMWSVEGWGGREIREHRATYGCDHLPWLKDIALDGWFAFEPAL